MYLQQVSDFKDMVSGVFRIHFSEIFMARNLSYSYDFEAHEKLSQNQTVLFHGTFRDLTGNLISHISVICNILYVLVSLHPFY